MPDKRHGRTTLLLPRGAEIAAHEDRSRSEQDGRFVSPDEKRSAADVAVRASPARGDAEDHGARGQRDDRPGGRGAARLAVRSGNAESHRQRQQMSDRV